jgi:hypothetical protein
MLLRWLAGLDPKAWAWHETTFTRKRQWFIGGDVAPAFLCAWSPRA